MTINVVRGETNEGGGTLKIGVEHHGKTTRICAYPLWECPEDATLERDMSFAYDIVPLMKKAYEAGNAGESFEIIERGDEDE